MRAIVALALIAAALIAQTATAQETLTYTGADMTGTVVVTQVFGYPGSVPVSVTDPINGNITGSFTLSTPLPWNGTTTEVVVGAFSTPVAPTYADGEQFTFTTSNGVIVGWDAFADQCPCYGTESVGVGGYDGVGGDSYSVNIGLSPDSDGFGTTFYGSASSSTPGTWTIKGVPSTAPEIDPNLASGSLMLLLGGIAVLQGRRQVGGRVCQ